MRIAPLLAIGLAALGGFTGYSALRATPDAPAEVAGPHTMVEVILPATLSAKARLGQTAYEAKCAACHGPNGAGNLNAAPPLIHKIYEPGHHGDESFHRAAADGVQAHHWRFGNMPPVAGITRADVASIIAFIREVQRANAIF